METESNTQEVAQWKKKYFDQLEDAERKERQWADAEDLLRKTISRLALAADGVDSTLDRQLRDLRDAIRDRASTAQLRHCIDDMSSTLVKLDGRRRQRETGTEQRPSGLFARLFGGHKQPSPEPETAAVPAAAQAVTATSGAGESAREILIQLLERLSLPGALRERVEAIRERIETMSEGDSWDRVLQQIADLVQAIHARTGKEKQGITDFLTRLGEQLQQASQQLHSSSRIYDDSRQAGERLDSVVKKEITGIESSVRDAGDLDALRQLVQTHIDTVLQHLDTHREAEQQRYRDARDSMARMSEQLREMESEAETLRERIREERNQAMTDTLTGIPNRLAYEERLQQEVARWKRFGTPLVMVVWDVDLFKRINDRFGHKAGDKVLRTIARVLADGVRETDFVARYGGEEFVQLMTGSSIADCLPVAEKLRAAVEATGFHFREEAVVVTISCGLAEFRDGESTEQCFERADSALYKAKEEGRNRCEIAD